MLRRVKSFDASRWWVPAVMVLECGHKIIYEGNCNVVINLYEMYCPHCGEEGKREEEEKSEAD